MERTMLQAMADMTAKHLGMSQRPRVDYFEGDCEFALAHLKENRITIPRSFLQFGKNWMTYYVAHEVCHFFNDNTQHGNEFRALEDKALAFWGLKVIRKGRGKSVYPKALTLL